MVGDLRSPCRCILLNFCLPVCHEEFYFKDVALEEGGELTIPKVPGSTRDDVIEGGAKSKIMSLPSLIHIKRFPVPNQCKVSSSMRDMILAMAYID